MCLTFYMITKLHSVGFEFEQFEHICSPGVTYYYNDTEYTIGGMWDGTPCSELEQKIAREGIWLPTEGDLVRWLELTHHDIAIQYIDSYYHGKASDEYGNIFEGSGGDLLCCLYKIIYKICKRKGTVKPEQILILDIEN